jgi:two-component system response regulator YesN
MTALLVNQKKEEKDPIITFTIDYIESHYSKDLSLDIIADQMKITSGYLSSYFRDKTGIRFTDYLNEYRLNKAKTLLQETNFKIHEVSEKVGYQNVNSFIRIFKKMNGSTPSDFRRNIAR